jgi:hypothetical protein
MHVLGPALAGALAIIAPISAHANGPGSNMRPGIAGASANIVLVGDGGGSGGHSAAIGDRPTAGRAPQQWNRGPGFAHWGPNHQYGGWGFYGGPSVPTYWIYVPGSAVFDYPFSDWRGPTGGWGNP